MTNISAWRTCTYLVAMQPVVVVPAQVVVVVAKKHDIMPCVWDNI